jgi:small neutral amino acid transporter SnatA (MarC family)
MSVFAAAVTLFLVMDPVGSTPMFLSLLAQVDEHRRKRVILRELLVAFIVPLAIPLIAGPSAMATVILLSNQAPGRIWTWFLALVIASVAALVVLLSAEVLRRRLGARFLTAIERLMGMILATLSVQMLLTGIRDYVQSFG